METIDCGRKRGEAARTEHRVQHEVRPRNLEGGETRSERLDLTKLLETLQTKVVLLTRSQG